MKEGTGERGLSAVENILREGSCKVDFNEYANFSNLNNGRSALLSCLIKQYHT